MKYGFIGTGNMGGAILRAAAKAVPAESIYISNRSVEKTNALAAELGVNASDNHTIAESCDVIFLGVKPQMMAGVLCALKDTFKSRKDDFVLVSMAAALTISDIKDFSGGDWGIIRIMPNTPVAVGEGMTLYTADDRVSNELKAAFFEAMKFSGRLDEVTENLIDAGSVVSGCGPAFAYMFMEALADGGVECGLPRAKAQEYAAQMLVGAGKLLLESGESPGKLKDNVCSPGGSTIAGVHALEDGAFRGAVMDAARASYKRTKELGK